MTLPAWDQNDLEQLLTLVPTGPGRWQSRYGDANRNGRSYGGQLLGQAMRAALMEVPAERRPTMMQFLFLQGAMPDEPIDFEVTPLQDGKRFSSRHVRATQWGNRTVLDAQVTCALPMEAPEHADATAAPAGERPEDLPTLADMPQAMLDEISRLGGYSNDRKPSVEFRIPQPEHQLAIESLQPRFRFWMKVHQELPDDDRIQTSAFAYISDWWLNFSSLGVHLRGMGQRKLYISSLNHALWMHRPVRADRWLHVETVSPAAASGRGLSVARMHDLEGHLVASATQECLMAYAD